MDDNVIDLNEKRPQNLKKVTMDLSSVDICRADGLKGAIGRLSNRSEVIRRALHLLFWAFVKKEGDELVVLKKGKEIGRFKWVVKS